jgi:phosphoribosyl 1,2-cyclic phosphodiesterase
MRVVSLGSGSSGNALLIEAGPQGRTSILLDAGFPGRILVERLRQAGVSASQLSGILVTHEHTDHILGLPLFIKRYKIPTIADPRTLTAIEQTLAVLATGGSHGQQATVGDTSAPMDGLDIGIEDVSSMIEHGSCAFTVGSRRMIGDIEVRSFPVSHDAVAPCGYLLSAGGCRVCVVTDTGEVTDIMLEAINQADLLVLESNHDRERLLRGPYPYQLKQRILSASGHLSNDQAAGAVLRTWRGDGVRWLWLSHLSRTNNTPRLAMDTMRARITEARANPAQVHLSVLPPGMGCEWDSTQLWRQESLWEMQH